MPNIDRKTYLEAVRSIVQKKVTKSLIAFLVSKLPFLGLSWINPIVSIVVSKLVTVVLDETEIRIFFKYADIRCNQQGAEFERLSLQYYNNRTEENEKAAINALRDFVSLNTL